MMKVILKRQLNFFWLKTKLQKLQKSLNISKGRKLEKNPPDLFNIKMYFKVIRFHN